MYLSDKADQGDVLQSRHVLLQLAVLIVVDDIDNALDTRTQIEGIEVDFEPVVQVLEMRGGKIHHVHSNLQRKQKHHSRNR